jgi:hypothetical protein
MSAADAREELEAAAWRAVNLGGWTKSVWAEAVDALLALADAYATAVADERIAGRVHDRTVGRERLAQLDATVRGAA